MKRKRRGRVVEVPKEWVGNFTTKKTRADRKIKARCKILGRKKRLIEDEKFDFEQEIDSGYKETDSQ